LTLGHSPDPDDAFMFYALAKHLLPTPGYEFTHILQDIQTLNERAMRAELDITAISIHAYAYVLKDYALLRSGASMGDNYGPMLVGQRAFARDQIADQKIAIPGLMTSAFLALQLFLGLRKEQLNYIVVPFDEIFGALERGEADLGLIIHEGQLTYAGEGLVLSADLGQWWFAETGGLPLPLGGNAVKKSATRGSRSCRTFFTRASSTGWRIARRAWSTRCHSGAGWIARWPTSSSACT
jgi:1,4-dihydroxy-6-naphthoate synthase